MVYTFKADGKRLAYDSVSGAIFSISALQLKMLGAVELPLGPFCPTSLRYELAKFDSDDVDEAYGELYGWHKAGKLFGEEDGSAQLIADTTLYSEAVLRAAIDAAIAGGLSKRPFSVSGGDAELNEALLAHAEEMWRA